MQNFHRILCLIFLLCLAVMTGCRPAETPYEFILSTGTNAAPSSSSSETSASPSDPSAHIPESSPTVTPMPTPEVTPIPGGKTSSNPNYAGKKIIALTFDDGPDGNTPKLLDVLKEKQVPATFFVLGTQLETAANRETLKRAAAEGHEIGSHSYSHPQLKKLSDANILKEISDSCALIRQATGQNTILFRPPYGSYNQHIIDISGMAFVTWNVDSEDWLQLNYTNKVKPYAQEHGITTDEAMEILAEKLLFEESIDFDGNVNPPLVTRVKHGCIILCHDIHPATRILIEKLIDALNASGDYVFMTVSDMIKTESRAPQAGDRYSNMWLNNW